MCFKFTVMWHDIGSKHQLKGAKKLFTHRENSDEKVTITATTCLLLFKVALENSTMVAKTLILKIKQWCIEIDLHQHLFELLYDM